jgi:hypothetical protein
MPKKYSRYKQGHFTPINKTKYKGTYPVIFRSAWEKSAFMWLDRHPKCIEWGSESAVVEYMLNREKHRYFIDLTALFQTKDGVKKFYIEIKPYKYTVPPKPSANKKPQTLLQEKAAWLKNNAKWTAAKDFAKKHGGEFIIITEKQLFKK